MKNVSVQTALITGAMLGLGLTIGQPVSAMDAGDMILRIGAAHVAPDASSGGVLGSNGLGLISGTDGISVDDGVAASIQFTYMLSDSLGFSVLAATPFSHDIDGAGALGGLPVGEVKHLPPTLSLEYQFETTGWQPYLGLGVNYTTFFDESTTDQLNDALSGVLGASVTSSDLKLDDSVGVAAHAGADFDLTEQLTFSVSGWWLNIDTDADVIVNGTRATTVEVDIDPWVFSVGLGWKF